MTESKRGVEKIKQTGVKLQVAMQGMCDDSYETASKYVRQGVLGKVVMGSAATIEVRF